MDAMTFEKLEPVWGEQLDELVAEAQPALSAGADRELAMVNGQFSIVNWMAEHGLSVLREGSWNGGYKWVLRQCPWNAGHTDGGAWIVRLASGAIAAGCHHASCQGRDWRELRDLLEPEWRNPRDSRDSRYASEPSPVREPWRPPIPFHQWELPDFPTAVLPGWLRAWVEAEAEATQTPPDLAGMLVLAVLAAAVARRACVEVRPGYREPLNLFTVIALPPGNRKSAVFSHAVAPLEEWEAEATRAAEGEIASIQNRLKIEEATLQKLQGEAARAGNEDRARLERVAEEKAREVAELRVPTRPRLLADDASPERLATLLRDQGGRIAVMSPEGDVFDIMAGRYSGAGSPNLGVYLKGHAGDTLRVDRVNRGAEYVRDPALVVGLAVQPDVLRGLVDKPGFRGRGLLGRFLYSLPVSRLGRRNVEPEPPPWEVVQAYRNAIQALLRMPSAADEDREPVPHSLPVWVIPFSREARERLRDWESWLEPQLAPDGELGTLTDWAGKLAGASVRLAGLLHLAGDPHAHGRPPWHTAVSGETMARALFLADYLLAHARAAFAEMGADPAVEDALHVLAWIQSQERSVFSRRDVYKGTRPRFRRSTEVDPALALLEEHGYIRARCLDRTGPGRKPSPEYEASPWTVTGAAQNAQNAQNSARTPECLNA